MGESEEHVALETMNPEKVDYIDELTGLSEPKGDLTFASSNTVLTMRDPNMHSMGQAIAVFLLPPAVAKERAGPAVSAPLGPFFHRLTLSLRAVHCHDALLRRSCS